MKIPELLAPVGSRDALTAAVQNGADAVYLGGTMFSARKYADNFSRDTLKEALEYAHARDVRVYLTVNTLISDQEMPEALDYLKFLYEAGADAVIVQDLGLARAARELLPQLCLHASTQMTLHNSAGAGLLKNLGINRVVLARELSLAEIIEIKEKTGMETEVFVHGALCISYSGQCLMSSMIGGRSGNRGRCAQPCRMEYTLVDGRGKPLVEPEKAGRYLLSPRDLNMLEHLPDLARAGIDSLKVEGRMKRPEYVATVTRIYRAALDRYRESPEHFAVSEQELKDLAQIFNRGFSTGYFFGNRGTDMMSFKRPNNRGLLLGRVTRSDWSKGLIELELQDSLNRGDGVEFWVTEGGRRGTVVSRILLKGREVEAAQAGDKVWIKGEGRIRPGDRVFKTLDAKLMVLAEQSYKSPRETKKIPVDFKMKAEAGLNPELTVTDRKGRHFTARGSEPAQQALTKPLTFDYLVRQLDRLGNTPFALNSLEADIGDRVMVPASELNELRRQAVEGLTALRAAPGRNRGRVEPGFGERVNAYLEADKTPSGKTAGNLDPAGEAPRLTIRVRSLESLRAAAAHGADVIYFGGTNLLNPDRLKQELSEAVEICNKTGAKLVAAAPRIVREPEMKHVLPLLEFAEDNGLAVLAANLGILTEASQRRLTGIYADFPLNLFNGLTVRWLAETGVTQACLSPELTLHQIRHLSGLVRIPLEAVVEGHLPLMVTEHCPVGSLLGGRSAGAACSGVCRPARPVGLQDRLGLVFPTTRDEFCRTSIYNAKELSMIEDISPLVNAGISRLRIETSVEDPAKTAEVTKYWRTELDAYLASPEGYRPDERARPALAEMSPAGLTKGHYYRGVE